MSFLPDQDAPAAKPRQRESAAAGGIRSRADGKSALRSLPHLDEAEEAGMRGERIARAAA
jgi:hypothetical protein